jgi:hypothetical protein
VTSCNWRRFRVIVALAVVGLVALAAIADAGACVCADVPLSERLDDSDAAIVGRVHGFGVTDSDVPLRLMSFDVEQSVKGDVRGEVQGIEARRIIVRIPSGTDCDLTIESGTTTGLLLTRLPAGGWYATACSVVAPGQLVAAGGEPRGGVIKVGIGIVILAIVLGWALRRLRRGSRPDLPGAPEP